MCFKKIFSGFLIFSFLIVIFSVSPDYGNLCSKKEDEYIKWVEFNVPAPVIRRAMQLDINSRNKEENIDFIEVLSYMGAKNYGIFKNIKISDVDKAVNELKSKTEKPKLYDYYVNAYSAILSEYIGEYEKDGKIMYGMKVKHPVAGYYSECDDFGSARDYGFKRKHLGHDFMTSTGVGILAVEDGVIEALGWNRYGGWRIGIRSYDGIRYYYYAHLRKGNPYAKGIKEGQTVKAGQLIGYVGRTGYSFKEDVNNIEVPHLHFGIQLIFNEKQKDGNNQIWINCYEISKLLRNPPQSIEVFTPLSIKTAPNNDVTPKS